MNEYVYYYIPNGNGLEDIAAVRNTEMSEAELAKMVEWLEAQGHRYSRMVAYVGYAKPDFARTVQV